MAGLMFSAYGVGGLLLADSLANIGTTGHNWQTELFISLTALFVGGMAKLIKGGNN